TEQYTTAFAKMSAHVSTPPPSLAERASGVPAGLVKLIDSMLAKDPAKRPQTPEQVAAKLARFAHGSDLPALAQRAAAASPPALHRIAATTSQPGTALGKTLRHRTVPLPVAIAAG